MANDALRIINTILDNESLDAFLKDICENGGQLRLSVCVSKSKPGMTIYNVVNDNGMCWVVSTEGDTEVYEFLGDIPEEKSPRHNL